MAQVQLKGKLLIGAVLTVKTGLHIGDSSDFAPIGAVDSPFIRDPLTKAPIIPGSSLKGKMRTLLGKELDEKVEEDDGNITLVRAEWKKMGKSVSQSLKRMRLLLPVCLVSVPIQKRGRLVCSSEMLLLRKKAGISLKI